MLERERESVLERERVRDYVKVDCSVWVIHSAGQL